MWMITWPGPRRGAGSNLAGVRDLGSAPGVRLKVRSVGKPDTSTAESASKLM